MKMLSALAVAAVMAVGLEAQTTTKTTTETKVKVEDGRDTTVIGCIERTADKEGYVLTNLSGDSQKHKTYLLIVDEDEDLDKITKHVGHKVEMKGKVVDNNDGEVEITSKTEREVEHGQDQKSEVKTEIKGTRAGSPYLGVESVKMISDLCP
jgi:hypothetical protein